jgi:hypothetical protein
MGFFKGIDRARHGADRRGFEHVDVPAKSQKTTATPAKQLHCIARRRYFRGAPKAAFGRPSAYSREAVKMTVLCPPVNRSSRDRGLGSKLAEPCGLGPYARAIVMSQRRRVKQTTSLKDRLATFAEQLKAEATKLRPGPQRSTQKSPAGRHCIPH